MAGKARMASDSLNSSALANRVDRLARAVIGETALRDVRVGEHHSLAVKRANTRCLPAYANHLAHLRASYLNEVAHLKRLI